MIAAGIGTWLAAAAVVDRRTALEVLLGMVGPLAVVSVTWVLMARTYRANPGRLTSVMTAAFFGKMIVFGGYVALMLGVLSLRPIPFVASFTTYFIGLYAMQALYLRQMLAGPAEERRIPAEGGRRSAR
jgi:CHASE2 domain-containing sensor protein